MIDTTAGVGNSGLNIVRFQIGHLIENLGGGEAIGEEIEHIGDPNAHASDAWASATLGRIHGDAFEQSLHSGV